MRLNQFLARHTELSRRSADEAIRSGRVEINGIPAKLGDIVVPTDRVTLDSHAIITLVNTITILLNKPMGYVCSRKGQGSKTIYDLLPQEYHHLNPVGRLDKDSSGLLLLTNDGDLANQLTHPRFGKQKTYEITLDKPLKEADRATIHETGVNLEDGPSKLHLTPVDTRKTRWIVRMKEGRNRQIRRTFSALGYKVTRLKRTHFGPYTLHDLNSGNFSVII